MPAWLKIADDRLHRQAVLLSPVPTSSDPSIKATLGHPSHQGTVHIPLRARYANSRVTLPLLPEQASKLPKIILKKSDAFFGAPLSGVVVHCRHRQMGRARILQNIASRLVRPFLRGAVETMGSITTQSWREHQD